METVAFFVPGAPQSKGSFTRMPNGAMLPAGTKESRERKLSWARLVHECGELAMMGRDVWHGPVRIMVEFSLAYPVSSMRKYQMGWWPHLKQPDVDKLMRALLDPLSGVVWRDDSQVCFALVNKTYAWDDHPGTTVVVDFLDDDYMQRFAAAGSVVRRAMDAL